MDRKSTIRAMLISLAAVCTTVLAAGYGYSVISGHGGESDSGHAEPAGTGAAAIAASPLPPLAEGMVNVTRGGRVRLPAGFTGEVSVPYDTALLPRGYTAEDISTYRYDRAAGAWERLERGGSDTAACVLTVLWQPEEADAGSAPDGDGGKGGENSPIDFINAVITAPEMPETQNYTPTMMSDMKAAEPLEGLRLIEPPAANSRGTAELSYTSIGRTGVIYRCSEQQGHCRIKLSA